ncbi:Transposase, Mutator family [Pedobacter westerhofensis]|uniref:Transposase, Mutator family n=1 Tax=Pedobacter westerhofensis TaxID=425512 RepID=A0A521FRA5_9SPHI|nr:transposase [Pedobacter westerhofensis]SMO98747.1 Transposase, Mutator family [Pedobacter westerhofensis]
MEKNDLWLPKDFFKQFKSKEHFDEFFQGMFKQGINEMLQGELDDQLGYEKHASEGRNSGNSRNGSSSEKVKSES